MESVSQYDLDFQKIQRETLMMRKKSSYWGKSSSQQLSGDLPRISTMKDILNMENMEHPSEFHQESNQRLKMTSIDLDLMTQPSLNSRGKYETCKNKDIQNQKMEQKMRSSFHTSFNRFNKVSSDQNLHQKCSGHAHETNVKNGKRIKVVYFQPSLVARSANDDSVNIFTQKYQEKSISYTLPELSDYADKRLSKAAAEKFLAECSSLFRVIKKFKHMFR